MPNRTMDMLRLNTTEITTITFFSLVASSAAFKLLAILADGWSEVGSVTISTITFPPYRSLKLAVTYIHASSVKTGQNSYIFTAYKHSHVEVIFKSNYIWKLLNLVNIAVFLPSRDKTPVAYNVPILKLSFWQKVCMHYTKSAY